ncbi:Protein FAR-RED IMPAIRED RESPONSE 1, partial [Bienertia sinuspersici]
DVLLLEESGEGGFCDEGGVGVDADVVGDVGCTPTKECSDVVALAPPAIGMVFSSWQEVETYYRAYAKHEGFGVVRAAWSGYKAKDKTTQCRNAQWTCDRFGKLDWRRKIEDDLGVKTSKKCECPVMIYATVNAKNEWLVRLVVNEHQNHNPTPSKSRFIATHCKEEMNYHVKRKLKERNGLQEMAINERDVRNEFYKEKKLKLKDGDAKAMLEYFEKMTEGNQFFSHMCRLDNFGQLQDILWVDARSRAAYEEFNDVVCFDTTYLTNQYELPFANFVGVNYHGLTILLGCALISHETEWVSRTWVHCMRGIAPGGILTNQEAAMRNALRSTMPETRHRWCIWHIIEKFSQKLGKCKVYNEFKDELLMNS